MKEIGSEFWDTYAQYVKEAADTGIRIDWGIQSRILASGRTAIDHIIKDIKARQSIKSVYMPSYCCHTMIEPFVTNGINVQYYDIRLSSNDGLEYCIDPSNECDAVYIMQYFGYLCASVYDIARYFKDKGKVIIEDATHSVFCEPPFTGVSDYVFASMRKWAAIPGAAIVSNIKSPFIIPEPIETHKEYTSIRVEAMNQKEAYISSESADKEVYLESFRKAEEILDRDYQNYISDPLSRYILNSLDINTIKKKRIANANVLLDGVAKLNYLAPLFKSIEDKECPLFVPIIVVTKELREKLRQHLINNKIYCPSHWPQSYFHKANKYTRPLYDLEISLVCDQRYNENDMNHVIKALRSF